MGVVVVVINYQGSDLPSRQRGPWTPRSRWAGDPVSPSPRIHVCGPELKYNNDDILNVI